MSEKICNERFAYIAGLFDGEGTVLINERKSTSTYHRDFPSYALSIVISNSDRGIIDWLNDTYGGYVNEHSEDAGFESHRPSWQWKKFGTEAMGFLKLMLPFLRIKRRQVELAIAFQKSKDAIKGTCITEDIVKRRQWYKYSISELNQGRGEEYGI